MRSPFRLLSTRFVILLLLTVLLCTTVCYAAQGDVNQLLYNTLKASDSTITGAATATLTAGGAIQWPNTMYAGVGNRAMTTVMDMDRCFHMNTLGELFVTLAALRLHADTAFTLTLDDTLSTKYTPNNLTFTNPKNGYNVTYKQLMQHTSSILDTSFASYSTTTGTVGTLQQFISDYFIVSSTGQLNTNVFSTNQPGLAGSYSFARANTALLSFVLENVIADQALPYTSLAQYITSVFLTPLGMSSTFFLTSSTFPGLQTTLTSTAVNSTVSSPYFSSCVIDQMNTITTLHPAGFADYMGFTTASDMIRLIRGLFYGTQFSTLVSLMRDSIAVTAALARMSGQKGEGLGLMFFNGDTVCTSAKSTFVISSCPVSNLSTVYGYISNRDFIENGFLCTDSSTTSGLVCVVSTVVHSSSSTRGPSNIMGMAAVTFQDLFGTVSVSQVPAGEALPEQPQSEWFGVYCFLGVYLSLMGAYFGSMILQWMFQPAALAQATDSSGAASLSYGAARRSPNRDSILGD